MVTGSIKMLWEENKKLLQIDPEGIERVEVLYGTVGLTFWLRDKDI
jgi:hypothetical protein